MLLQDGVCQRTMPRYEARLQISVITAISPGPQRLLLRNCLLPVFARHTVKPESTGHHGVNPILGRGLHRVRQARLGGIPDVSTNGFHLSVTLCVVFAIIE